MSYYNYKTPFYTLSVGDAGGRHMVDLPAQILRLLEKVEINESITGGCVYSTVTLHFDEGSREPFSVNKTSDTSSVYKGVGKDSNLTNRTGMLSDLVFTDFGGSIGISSIDPSEIGKNPAVALAAKILDAIASDPGVKLDNTIKQNKKVHYLFQENNQIKITWGYKEDKPSNWRTVRAHIKTVQSEFPETGPIKTIINCIPPTGLVDQFAATAGINFTNSSLAGTSASKGALYVYTDKELTEVIKEIGNKLGDPNPIVSDDLNTSKLGNYGSKKLLAGESLHQFLIKKASESNAYYTIYLEPSTGNPKLLFVKKEELQKDPIVSDKSLFAYKQPGSIVKSISIKVDFDGIVGHAIKGYTLDGKSKNIGSNHSSTSEVLFENQKKLDGDPTSSNPSSAAKSLKDEFASDFDGVVGTVEVTPVEEEAHDKTKTYSKTACQSSKLVMLEMNTLGHTRLSSPFTIPISGIGDRYSGHYTIRSVVHTIDSSSYTCHITAQSGAVSGELGVKPPEATNGSNKEVNVEEILFKSAAILSIPQGNSLGDTYKKSVGLA